MASHRGAAVPHRTRAGSARGAQKVEHEMHKRYLTLVAAVLALLVTSACGGDDDPLADEGSGGSGSDGDKGTLVLGGQDFTEMQIMASVYQLLLEDAGYTVDTQLVSTRKIYL